ncbi:MAG: sigma factor-like helix-turn-helix DNA-binding protein [Planctomycetota bacterium]
MATRTEDPTLDLRRKRRRALVAQIVDASEHLPEQERQLLLAVYGRGMRVSEVAVMLGVPERRLRRRVRALLKRVTDPAFAAVVRHGSSWPRQLHAVARLAVIEGLPMRVIASRLGLSYHQVRQHCATMHTLVAALPGRETAA